MTCRYCDRPVRARGMCIAHYKRWWTSGDPENVRPRGRLLNSAPIVHLLARRGWTDGHAAQRIGVARETIVRWRGGARIHELLADEVALALDVNPVDFWPDWYEEDAA